MALREHRLILLTALAAALGIVSGAAAWVLLRGIALLTNLTLFSRVGYELPSFATLQPSLRIVVVATAGAFVVALLAVWTSRLQRSDWRPWPRCSVQPHRRRSPPSSSSWRSPTTSR